MRRVVAILLLALLPLHLSWAAVAPYCGHELVSQSPQPEQHFGHHDHTAVAAAAEPQQLSDDAGAAQDGAQPDCGQCHNHCTGVLVAPAIVHSSASGEVLGAAQPASAADQLPAPPERPQWASLA